MFANDATILTVQLSMKPNEFHRAALVNFHLTETWDDYACIQLRVQSDRHLFNCLVHCQNGLVCSFLQLCHTFSVLVRNINKHN